MFCSGVQPLRLANGTDRCSGRVEMFHDGQWGTVCDDDWDMHEGEVVCRAMDCGSPLMVPSSAHFGMGDGNIWLDDVHCSGNETSLIHCLHPMFGENNCGHGEDAGVVCSGILVTKTGRQLGQRNRSRFQMFLGLVLVAGVVCSGNLRGFM